MDQYVNPLPPTHAHSLTIRSFLQIAQSPDMPTKWNKTVNNNTSENNPLKYSNFHYFNTIQQMDSHHNHLRNVPINVTHVETTYNKSHYK